jgi:hypothetical protein
VVDVEVGVEDVDVTLDMAGVTEVTEMVGVTKVVVVVAGVVGVVDTVDDPPEGIEIYRNVSVGSGR